MDSVSDSLETDVKIKHMNAILKILLDAHKKNDTNRLQTIEISIDSIFIMLSIFCFLFLIRTRQECLCQGPNRNLHSGQQLLRSKGIELLHLRPQNRVAETSSFDALIKIKHT